MENKELKIVAPEGYEIDKENSSFEKIVFKAKKSLPQSWDEMPRLIRSYDFYNNQTVEHPCDTLHGRITFPSPELAIAGRAIAKLAHLRDIYNDGWEADWRRLNQIKYLIYFSVDKIETSTYLLNNTFLAFKDKKTRDLFLNNFRDLIEQAKPLL